MGLLFFVFEDGMGYECWVDYVLDVLMYFVYCDGKYINVLGQSFCDFMKGWLFVLFGEILILLDWVDYLIIVFFEVCVKKFIEMCGVDGGLWCRFCVLFVLWVGLIYDQLVLDVVWDLCCGWSVEQCNGLWVVVVCDGFVGEYDGLYLYDIVCDVLEIVEYGLKNCVCFGQGGLVFDEMYFLNVLCESVDIGKVFVDELLVKYKGEWVGDLFCIYGEYFY